MLPRDVRTLSTIRCTGISVPAGTIGGDYYDFLDLGPESLGFVLADISGKGIAAALLVANLQASLRSECARGCRSLSEILHRVNARFFESTLPEQYATLFFGHYDDRRRLMQYINCGHTPAMLVRANGFAERLAATAPPLGMFEKWSCEERVVDLNRNDTLFLYSDGVTEAGIATGEEFGTERLISIIQASRHCDIETTVRRVISGIRTHAPGAASDDVAAVAIRSV